MDLSIDDLSQCCDSLQMPSMYVLGRVRHVRTREGDMILLPSKIHGKVRVVYSSMDIYMGWQWHASTVCRAIG